MGKVLTTADQIDFVLDDIQPMPLPDKVLMVQPDYFDVEYVINPHMASNIGKVNKDKAQKEWSAIRDTFREIGMDVIELEGVEGLPDMVFSANQSLPGIMPGDKKEVFMSIMHAEERKEEVPYIEQWYRQNGYEIHYLDSDQITDFEGMGDALWHTGRRLLWGGYGYRSSLEAYDTISDTFEAPVVALKLVDEAFYHLDTCLCMLDDETALIYPEAFTDEGLEMIRKLIPNIIEADEHEARNLFACNATCPDGQNVIIQEGCEHVNQQLKEERFKVHEVSTKEFLKSGGSVFCLKMLLW